MDIGTIHSIWTIVLFVSFIGVVWWAYGKSRRSRFEEAANLCLTMSHKSKSMRPPKHKSKE